VAPVCPRSVRDKQRAVQGNPAYPPGIEGVKMRKVYYNPVRKLTLVLPLLASALLAAQQGPSPQPSSLKTASLESHEGLTITARPWTDPALYKEKFHKKSPFDAGIVALQVAFRNDSDDSMKITLERIRLNIAISEEEKQALEPLSSEQAADVITHPGAKNVTTRKLPIPLGGPKIGRDKKWMEVEQEIRNAGVQASVIAPHTTAQGLVYFDLRSQFDLLSNAHLYVPEVIAIEKNRGLLYFEIDLGRSGDR
jgi:hypothetical protein